MFNKQRRVSMADTGTRVCTPYLKLLTVHDHANVKRIGWPRVHPEGRQSSHQRVKRLLHEPSFPRSLIFDPTQRNTMRLRRSESCPNHQSLFCWSPGIRRIEDPRHPGGYRELRFPAKMRKLINRKIVEQDRKCAICHEEFTDYNDIVPDPSDPKGMGGAWRDDHPDNIQAVHYWCNSEKGSTRRDD